jgi:hypothetical protein
VRLKEPSTQYVCLAEIAVFRSHEVWKEYQETRRQFRVTFTFTNSLGAAVPVIVAVTVVVPACGVSGWGDGHGGAVEVSGSAVLEGRQILRP